MVNRNNREFKRVGLAPLIANYALWGVIALRYCQLGDFLINRDDHVRLVLALQWAENPYFFPEDVYWLPLQFWLYGGWSWLVQDHLGVCWNVPLSVLLLATGALSIQRTALLLRTIALPQIQSQAVLWFALLLLAMPPVSWRLASSGMSEPLLLALQGAMLYSFVCCFVRGDLPPWLSLAGSLIAQEMLRYETWPFVICVWAVAAWLAPLPVKTAPRGLRWLVLLGGWAMLLVFPSIWMTLNVLHNGDALYFLIPARHGTDYLDTQLKYTLYGRLHFLAELIVRQGGIMIVIAAAGLILFRKRGVMRPYGWLVLLFWALYFQGVLSNMIASSCPNRFTVAPLWACVPVAAVAMEWAWHHPRRVWRALIVSVMLLMAHQMRYWALRMGGEPGLGRQDVATLRDFQALAAAQPTFFVIDGTYVRDRYLNLLRLYVGLDRVQLADWYSASNPAEGNFVLITAKESNSIVRDGRIFDRNYYQLDRMPANIFELE